MPKQLPPHQILFPENQQEFANDLSNWTGHWKAMCVIFTVINDEVESGMATREGKKLLKECIKLKEDYKKYLFRMNFFVNNFNKRFHEDYKKEWIYDKNRPKPKKMKK